MKHFYRNPFSPILVKFGVCFLLLGVAYRLFSSSFVQFSPAEVSDNDATALSVNKTSLPPRPEISDGNFDSNNGESIFLFLSLPSVKLFEDDFL